MLEAIVGDNGSRFIIAAGAVAIGLLCLVAVLWIMRRRPSSPFVRGGKNRQPRLAVLDAAAVDTRRRLVLVRRDDVEHLIMIGGPTDIVIESRIVPDGAAAPSSVRPAEAQSATDARVAKARPEEQSQAAPIQAPAAEPVRQPQPDEPVRAAVRAEPAPIHDLAAVPHPVPPAQPTLQQAFARVQPPAPATPPLPAVERQEGPGALRDRVLPIAERSTQAAPEPRPIVQPQPVPARPAMAERAADFERILDAEISSDLQRLTPTVTPRQPSGPTANLRQEPVLGAASTGVRKEPSIDEEMTRMLADISAGRKP